MIDQTIQFAVGSGAAPVNVMPASFNPVPDDGSLEIWACLDALTAGNQAPTLSVTLGGATPIQPIQPTAIRVNEFGINGAGPSLTDMVMPKQGVQRGTNSQLTLTGGNQNVTGRIRIRFLSLNEISQGIGAAA